MKPILTMAFLACIAFWLVWVFGMVFEFEYPYALTLMRVGDARSVNGASASEIIRADGARWGKRLPWHTCSYEADWCGHRNLICVRLEAPDDSTCYYFAYCCDSRQLVPMTPGTATHFPALMPANDSVQNINQLNGIAGTASVGFGNLELPTKWFRTATHEPSGMANGKQASPAKSHP